MVIHASSVVDTDAQISRSKFLLLFPQQEERLDRSEWLPALPIDPEHEQSPVDEGNVI